MASELGFPHDPRMRSSPRPRRLVPAATAVAAALVITTVAPGAPADAVVERTPVTSQARLVSAFGTVPATFGPRDTPELSDTKGVSNDGRFVLFTTVDRGSSSDKNDVADVYLRDMSDGSTSLISQDAGHAVGGRSPSMGPDGRFVAFITGASLVAGDTGGDDLYVLDRRSGRMRLGNRALADPAGVVPAGRAQVSNDGSTVAWIGADMETLRVRHLDGGTLVAVPSPGPDMRGVQLSGNGRYLFAAAIGRAWRINTETGAYDIVSDGSMTPSISACEISISYDGTRATVTSCAGGIYLWNASSPGVRTLVPSTSTVISRWAALSGDGRFIVYRDLHDGYGEFRRIDLKTGADLALDGGVDPVLHEGVPVPIVPEISGDGMIQVVASSSSVAGQTTTSAQRLWAVSGSTVPGSTMWAWQKGLYQQVLGRVPTTAEADAATAALATQRRTAPQLIQDLLHTPSFLAPRAPMIRLYQAFFLRAPDSSGYQYWVNRRLAGRTLVSIASQFAASSEFTNRYGTLTNQQFVNLVYENVLGRLGDPGGRAYWTNKLDNGTATRGSVMVGFSESSEYVGKMANQVDYVMGAKAARGTVPTNGELAAARTRWAAGVSVTSDLRDLFDVT